MTLQYKSIKHDEVVSNRRFIEKKTYYARASPNREQNTKQFFSLRLISVDK